MFKDTTLHPATVPISPEYDGRGHQSKSIASETPPFENIGDPVDDYCFTNINPNAVFGLALGASLGVLLAIFAVHFCLIAAMDAGAIPHPPTLQQYVT